VANGPTGVVANAVCFSLLSGDAAEQQREIVEQEPWRTGRPDFVSEPSTRWSRPRSPSTHEAGRTHMYALRAPASWLSTTGLGGTDTL
jgi:hypothetical protein